MGRSHGREGRKERSERDSTHEDSKILGEFYNHKKTVNKKRVETKEGIQKKILGTQKKICKRTKLTITIDDRAHAKVNDATPRAKRVTELRCGQTAC